MKFSTKAWLLVAAGGAALDAQVIAVLLYSKQRIPLESSQDLKALLFFFLVGATITAVFGIPVLLLIEKFFGKYRLRYVVGGIFSSWLAWFFLVGPLFTPSPWFEVRSWVLSGVNHVGLYLAMGLIVGVAFSLMVWRLERSTTKNRTA